MWILGCSHHTGSLSVTDNKNLSVEVRSNGQQKRAICFATLLQNEFNGNVSRFTSHVQGYLATIQVIADFKNLLQKVESRPFFCNKIFTCCAFYRPKANSFWAKRGERGILRAAREAKKIKLSFFSSPRFALRAKYRVRLAWLIKLLLCRLFCTKWRNSLVWRDSCVILSNQKSVFTPLATV